MERYSTSLYGDDQMSEETEHPTCESCGGLDGDHDDDCDQD